MAQPGGQLRVVQGPQVWRLLRTDRDGASEREIPQMAAAAVRWMLLRSRLDMGAKHELVAVGDGKWRFGPVRPFEVGYVGRTEPPLPGGRVLGDRAQSVPGTVPTVRGQYPWWVVATLWWREPDVTVPWPGLSESLVGRRRELNGADWVLDRSVALPAGRDPGDETWGQAMGDQASEALKSAGAGLGKVLLTGGGAIGLLVLAWLALTRRGRND